MMRHGPRKLWLVSAGALLSVATAACIPGPYPADFFQEMHYTATQRRTEPNRAPPPADSVPVTGRAPRMSFAQSAQVANPLTSDAGVVAHGRELVRTNCSVCHGPDGNGQTAPMIAPFYRNNPTAPVTPPAFSSDRVRSRTDGQLYWIIGHGLGNMPAFGSELNTNDIWSIVAFVRGQAGS